MVRKIDVCFLGSESPRSRAYVSCLAQRGLAFGFAVVVESDLVVPGSDRRFSSRYFDNEASVVQQLSAQGTPLKRIRASDVNDEIVASALEDADQQVVVFSGRSGELVRRRLFATRCRFLHVHPGRLPTYRGSTPMYYSLLADQAIVATAIELRPEIDTGPIILERAFEPPLDRRTIDLEFDPWMRGTVMADVLERYVEDGSLPLREQPAAGSTFYVIHPVLKHLAIMGGRLTADDPGGTRGAE